MASICRLVLTSSAEVTASAGTSSSAAGPPAAEAGTAGSATVAAAGAAGSFAFATDGVVYQILPGEGVTSVRRKRRHGAEGVATLDAIASACRYQPCLSSCVKEVFDPTETHARARLPCICKA